MIQSLMTVSTAVQMAISLQKVDEECNEDDQMYGVLVVVCMKLGRVWSHGVIFEREICLVIALFY